MPSQGLGVPHQATKTPKMTSTDQLLHAFWTQDFYVLMLLVQVQTNNPAKTNETKLRLNAKSDFEGKTPNLTN